MLVEELSRVLPIIIYLLLIVLIVVLIMFFLKANKSIDKVNDILDDTEKKLHTLDGVFGIAAILDNKLTSSVGKVISYIEGVFDNLFKKRKRTIEDEELDELLKEEE